MQIFQNHGAQTQLERRRAAFLAKIFGVAGQGAKFTFKGQAPGVQRRAAGRAVHTQVHMHRTGVIHVAGQDAVEIWRAARAVVRLLHTHGGGHIAAVFFGGGQAELGLDHGGVEVVRLVAGDCCVQLDAVHNAVGWRNGVGVCRAWLMRVQGFDVAGADIVGVGVIHSQRATGKAGGGSKRGQGEQKRGRDF